MSFPSSDRFWKILLSLVFAVGAANLWCTTKLLHHQKDISRQNAFWTLCQPGYDIMARKSAFLLLVGEGNKEWRSAILEEIDLHSVKLPGANISGAAFRRATLTFANFDGARLMKSSFELADLSNADLSRADLTEAQLYRATLKGAKLNRTVLRAANLQEAKAESAQLIAADLEDSDCLMADFTGANLSGAIMSGARLEGARFSGANLSLTRVADANVRNADFTNCNWWRARGFTAEKLDWLEKNLRPGTNAPAEVAQDFDKWLAQREPALKK